METMATYLERLDVAKRVGVTHQRIYQLEKEGLLPAPDSRTVNGKPLWLPATIDQWMSETGRRKG
jgi:predicted DNA-binding transcriptional regulator AlpA